MPEREKTDASFKCVRVNVNGAFCIIDIAVKQMTGKELPPGFMLVMFEDKTPVKAADEKKTGAVKAKKQDTALQSLEQELQSTNEELATVNAELQNKMDEFIKANNDRNNLLAATDIASMFLDADLCIKSEKLAARIGVKAFAYKPVDKAELAKTIRRVLDAVS